MGGTIIDEFPSISTPPSPGRLTPPPNMDDNDACTASKDRVLQLIRLDRELTGELLLRHPEKMTVHSVVAQLEGRRDLQHWYIGLLFDRSPEMYGAQEFAPLHVLQVCKIVVGYGRWVGCKYDLFCVRLRCFFFNRISQYFAHSS